MVAVRSDLPTELTLDEARRAVERERDGLVDSLLAARPEEIRRLARTALDAERALFRRRGAIGAEPAYPVDEATRAIAGYAALNDARRDTENASKDARRWLMLGNVWGVGALGLAGVLVTKAGVSLMAAPIALTVAAAAGGPLSTTVRGMRRCSRSGVRVGAARATWASAVEQAGFTTYGELQATRLAHEAWQRRCQEAEAAAKVSEAARTAWHAVAGPNRHPREAPVLLAKMAVLRAAQIDLLRLLLEQRASLTEVDVRNEPVVVAAVADPAKVEPVPGDASPTVRVPRGRRLLFWAR